MKCSVCKQKIEKTFLNKINGSYIKDSKGKLKAICGNCQKKFNNDKEKLLQEIK
jgi:hypothetical protein